jgi:hypothetical protein
MDGTSKTTHATKWLAGLGKISKQGVNYPGRVV